MSTHRMPSGVVPPSFVANHIMSVQRGGRKVTPPRVHHALPKIRGQEEVYRARLLKRARRGRARAIAELWDRYRLRLILPHAAQEVSTC